LAHNSSGNYLQAAIISDLNVQSAWSLQQAVRFVNLNVPNAPQGGIGIMVAIPQST